LGVVVIFEQNVQVLGPDFCEPVRKVLLRVRAVAVVAVVAPAFGGGLAFEPGSYRAVVPAGPVPPRRAVVGLAVVVVVVLIVAIAERERVKTVNLQLTNNSFHE
jgi:hypothetical protein